MKSNLETDARSALLLLSKLKHEALWNLLMLVLRNALLLLSKFKSASSVEIQFGTKARSALLLLSRLKQQLGNLLNLSFPYANSRSRTQTLFLLDPLNVQTEKIPPLKKRELRFHSRSCRAKSV